MRRLRLRQPVWLPQSARSRKPTHPRLLGEHEADVAIVGAGITGSTAAQCFADAGVRVAVVEVASRGAAGLDSADHRLFAFDRYR